MKSQAYRQFRARMRFCGCFALGLTLTCCGSQAQRDRNNAAMDAQLEAANANIAETDGRAAGAPITSATQVGQRMRAASSQAPRP